MPPERSFSMGIVETYGAAGTGGGVGSLSTPKRNCAVGGAAVRPREGATWALASRLPYVRKKDCGRAPQPEQPAELDHRGAHRRPRARRRHRLGARRVLAQHDQARRRFSLHRHRCWRDRAGPGGPPHLRRRLISGLTRAEHVQEGEPEVRPLRHLQQAGAPLEPAAMTSCGNSSPSPSSFPWAAECWELRLAIFFHG